MLDNGWVQIELLRRATAEDHNAVEGAMPLLGEGLTADGYCRTLERIYGLVCPWELTLLSEIAEPLRPFARERCRRDLLAADIRHLGSNPVDLPWAVLPVFHGHAELFGAMYVMEGSRLGGQFIARGVTERLGPVAKGSVSYFSGFETQTGSMWREFIKVISDVVPETETDSAIRGAKQMFGCFGEWISSQPNGVTAAKTGRAGVTS